MIDDEPEILAAFRALFELEGYACATFPSASALLSRLASQESTYPGPSCLLCDVMMPDQSGLELQQRLSRDPERPSRAGPAAPPGSGQSLCHPHGA